MHSGSESSEEEPTISLSKKQKAKKGIQRDLTVDMHTKSPESSSEFERLLKVTPDSSFLWIQFMAFHLQLSEIEKARETGRRALQVINYREEQEKLNVWIALLNLEISYGTEESAEQVFSEAVKANDAKTVHLRYASLLEEAGKLTVSRSNEVWADDPNSPLLNSKQRRFTSGARRSSVPVPRSGHYLESSICATIARTMLDYCSPAVSPAWTSGNVGSQSGLQGPELTNPQTSRRSRNLLSWNTVWATPNGPKPSLRESSTLIRSASIYGLSISIRRRSWQTSTQYGALAFCVRFLVLD